MLFLLPDTFLNILISFLGSDIVYSGSVSEEPSSPTLRVQDSLLHPENGGRMCLRNVGNVLPDYKSQARRQEP
jgi:hypothetical protein